MKMQNKITIKISCMFPRLFQLSFQALLFSIQIGLPFSEGYMTH